MRYRRVYTEGNPYFITVVTYKRNPILIDNIELLRESFRFAKRKFSFRIDAIAVLPDHFHMIILPENAKEYPRIVGTIKRYFSRHCDPSVYRNLVQSHSRRQQGYKAVWQKRFYEHTIRNDKDWRIRLDYIHYNPVKHGYVHKAKEWPYSSFDKFVKEGFYNSEWCDFNGDIDLE